jgi:hypothetical protein
MSKSIIETVDALTDHAADAQRHAIALAMALASRAAEVAYLEIFERVRKAIEAIERAQARPATGRNPGAYLH